MNTKPDELGCTDVEGKDPNDANGEQCQESKRNGVMLQREEQIRIGSNEKMATGYNAHMAFPCGSKTWRGELADGGDEEVDKRRGNDDTRTEILGEPVPICER
jgi:hypothetical protein